MTKNRSDDRAADVAETLRELARDIRMLETQAALLRDRLTATVSEVLTLAEAPPLEPLIYSVEQAAHLLSVPESKLYEMVRSGDIRAVKQGGSRGFAAQDVNDYVEQLRNAR